METSGHHLVYGVLSDLLTGETLLDTDDERIRQQLARLLTESLGYAVCELEPRLPIPGSNSRVDLTARIAGRRLFVLRYGPGSLVTREKPALAAARLLDPAYCIPFALVTNGRDAELLDALTGKVLARGLQAIPDRREAGLLRDQAAFVSYADPVRRAQALRILAVFDRDECCCAGKCAL